MRLQHFINEYGKLQKLRDLEPEPIARNISLSCKKYLKLLGNNYPLYKGLVPMSPTGTVTKLVGTKDVRKDRRPMATNYALFKFVNEWLKKKNWPTRDQSVICTSDEEWASSFDDLYYIFPINMRGYAWIKARDFNDSPEAEGITDWDIEDFHDLFEIGEEEAVLDELRKYVFGNKGFSYAYSKGYEIWIDCDKYFYLDNPGSYGGVDSKRWTKAFKDEGIKI